VVRRAVSAAALLTAFEPFGTWTSNPTEAAVQGAVAELRRRGIDAHGVVLPVRLAEAPRQLTEAFGRLRPRVLLLTGLHGASDRFHIEHRAVNRAAFRIPDEGGAQPAGEPLTEGAADERCTARPVAALARALRACGIPADESRDAGTFVCNATYWHALTLTPAALFLHVPPALGVTGGSSTEHGSSAVGVPSALIEEAVLRTAQLLLESP
jgi:pyroglutamyl-peptidase